MAISASLLPPAVNAGFFWALSLLVAATGGSVGMYGPKVFFVNFNPTTSHVSGDWWLLSVLNLDIG